MCKIRTLPLTTMCKYAIMMTKEAIEAVETLKDMRLSKNLTQKQACAMLGISLRSYIMYENDEALADSIKYRYMVDALSKYIALDEEHGILSMAEIKEKCKSVFDGYPVKYAILFGSYAKGTATQTSDVDILISADITGLRFYGIAERLRNTLKKKVDLLDVKQLNDNRNLLDEILKDGVRIYG